MYRTILVPLDGSPRAEAILPHVENLAQLCRAKVVLLQVDEQVWMLGRDEVIDMDRYNQASAARKAAIGSYLEGVAQRFQTLGIAVEVRIAYGPVVDAIMQTSAAVDAGLIAMASHGATGTPRVFYGRVSAGILQRVDRPLFLVRSRRLT